ncbi:hypothetical protein BGZ88_001070 [Linnemannia elongata]|nr:hypothetical protein BGZ88_001070 [Linnemannia elongata]
MLNSDFHAGPPVPQSSDNEHLVQDSEADINDQSIYSPEFLNSDRQVMLILGDSGSGKSSFCLNLESHLWNNYHQGDAIPLYISLPTIDTPSQNLVEKELFYHNFSDDKIQEMKLRRQFILICDGYDESQQVANLHTTNQLNQRDGWKAKMIVACRTQYLSLDYLDCFVPQLEGCYSKPRLDLFQEAMIIPLLDEQVENYVVRYVDLKRRSLSHNWTVTDCMTALTMIPNLLDLVKNPQWFSVNKLRLTSCNLYENEREMLYMMLEDGIESLGASFSSLLAQEIFEKQDGRPVVQYIHRKHKDTWKADFFAHNPEVRLLRALCPLSRSDSHHQFIHRSLLEYFFSRSIYGPDKQDDEEWPSPHLGYESPNEQILDPKGAFFTRNLLSEPSVIHFLSERMKQSPNFERQLRDIVELPNTDDTNTTIMAAANAMAILTESGVLM